MKRLFLAVLVLNWFVAADSLSFNVKRFNHTSTNFGQCGAGLGGADSFATQAGCGPSVGDPYATEGGASQFVAGSTATALNTSACPTALSASTRYVVTANITCAGNAVAFTYGNGTQIDLGGFTVTGRITQNGNLNGASIFHGTLNCAYSVADATAGCINARTDGVNVSSTMRIHHLTGTNTGSSSTIVTTWLYIEYTTATNPTMIPAIQIFNNAITMDLTSTASRNQIIRMVLSNQGPTLVEIAYNKLTCGANTQACQGVEDTNGRGTKAHHNWLVLNTNVTAESARGLVCDRNAVPTWEMGSEFSFNRIDANNNRAFRFRSCAQASAHDNLIIGAATTIEATGTFHLYDQNQAATETYSQLWLYSNNFKNTVSGTMFYGIAGTGVCIFNNTVTGTTGTAILALFNSTQAGGPTTAGLTNNATFNTPNFTANQSGAGVTTINTNTSGTGSGTGTINTGVSCP